MNVVSTSYLLFCSAVLGVSRLVSARHRPLALLAASYLFYAVWSLPLTALLALSTLVNFRVANPALESARTRIRLVGGVVFNVLILTAVKLAHLTAFPSDTGTLLMGSVGAVGVSFYTIAAIGYIVDSRYARRSERDTLLECALLLAWFPKMLAGPIERASSFIPQLRGALYASERDAVNAMRLIGMGLLRTFVIARPLGRLVVASEVSIPAVVWLPAFIFYVYNDFAAYSQLARGVSLMFGIHLTPNFRRPFFATSLSDFWLRWHHSFSMWLRDYVYLPMTRAMLRRNGNRVSTAILIVPAIVTMIASALWHAIDLRFLYWGVSLGALLVLNQMLRAAIGRRYGSVLHGFAARVTASILVSTVFCMAALPFLPRRSDNMSTAAIGEVVIMLILSLSLDWAEVRKPGEVYLQRPVFAAAAAVILLLICFCISAVIAPRPFVYERF